MAFQIDDNKKLVIKWTDGSFCMMFCVLEQLCRVLNDSAHVLLSDLPYGKFLLSVSRVCDNQSNRFNGKLCPWLFELAWFTVLLLGARERILTPIY